MIEGIERNARIRREGTATLVEGARHARVSRIVAQSIAWAYAPGPPPLTEDTPLDMAAPGIRRGTVQGIVALERLVTDTPGVGGLVLRYGHLYGPAPGADAPGEPPTVHVDAAAWAAVCALEGGAPGAYNVVDDGGPVSNARARRELGWDPSFRLPAASPA
jgi:nucleoside-diphosphate-sugar epimerase